ncbi:NAD-dependent epimerase/dehydratase family protein [Paenibacillus chartarius]|uniref:NAD-dependent epimerase/dehydratase family protein n=1 Tax=Paenibacillus chartarius TaxID=747481 RepID=A0ABV6DMR9_9BACL
MIETIAVRHERVQPFRFADKKVVVTGVSSFIGCYLAAHFSRLGADVVGTVSDEVSNYTGIRKERLQFVLSSGVRLERLNIEESITLSSFVLKEQPRLWLQHAGYVSGYESDGYDLNTANSINVLALKPLFEALAAAGAEGMILTGTMSEYGDTTAACLEEDACWPNTAYGLSKLAATLRARQLASLYGMKTRVARIFIPFGVLDSPRKLLPSALTALIAQRPLDLTACEQRRDFCSIQDIVEGYEALAADLERDVMFDIINLCGGSALSLKTLLMMMAAELSADPSVLRFGALPMRPGESMVNYGANDKARRLLGWVPRELESSLKTYVSEFRNRLRR